MDEEIKKKFAAMEARIDELETKVIEDCKFGCEGRERIIELMRGLNGYIKEVCQEERDDFVKTTNLIKKLSDKVNYEAKTNNIIGKEVLRLHNEFMKLDEVYYHIFPDRFAQDNRVICQIDEIFSKHDPDANPKKE